jgi:hypothetical protein
MTKSEPERGLHSNWVLPGTVHMISSLAGPLAGTAVLSESKHESSLLYYGVLCA